ncbi:Neuronal acetylcholine receptor subunit alpha-10 [Mizuhopecten yessoensis]|uniref:Neuronal acetylcholine receptor subunit alpha-10 n=1 Tax=Mizuhopecten yessoensis TaxID=6573 RepID=A0A210Q261_MIZYE|nr:Neuronal acetylcholine receptor subunit alpha-10 [Mizuhopecten yessoensis]
MESFGQFVFFCVFIVTILSQNAVRCATLDDTAKLHTDLFASYSNKRLPVLNHTDTLNVNISVYLLNIITLDAVTGVFELNFAVVMEWTDYRLAWNSSSYGGLTSYHLRPSYVWHPKLFLLTTADDLDTISGNDFIVNLQSTGQMMWITGKLMKSSCKVDMTNFPTDTQTCTFIITPWGFTPLEVYLSHSINTVDLRFLSPDGEWDIISTSVEQNTFYEPVISSVEIDVTLRRKSTYYMVSLVLPIIMIVLLSAATFLIPVSSSSRTSYTISMFLSFALYMSLISESIPEVSEPMAGISYFLMISLIASSLLLLTTIFTVRFNMVESLDEIPKWILVLMRRLKTCCFKSKKLNKVDKVTAIEDIEDKYDSESLNREPDTEELTLPEVKTFMDMFLFVLSNVIGLIIFIFYFGVYIKS